MKCTDRTICSGSLLEEAVVAGTAVFTEEQSHFHPFAPMAFSSHSQREDIAGLPASARTARSIRELEARDFGTHHDPNVDPRLTSDHRHGPGD